VVVAVKAAALEYHLLIELLLRLLLSGLQVQARGNRSRRENVAVEGRWKPRRHFAPFFEDHLPNAGRMVNSPGPKARAVTPPADRGSRLPAGIMAAFMR
jgi:hypothetical protein